ncbi:hypothetical protein ERO13_D12G076800v2 [Gossypium hirsutum]|uniref:Uncharacterized protein n=5 Tax=Gossypium TaxID=3633 RepID=A0A0D2TZK9_GOSRA|nr:hypothetical protein ES319_D12G089600v1 [Gossypium barbadense]KAG4115062.1 hypothetical protein ERO13_D12G076800v2 [Gossypium hirsutum]KJB48760.1 hypothetical protein B456_008G085600 [Gossypium raimondii]MBA0562612.1 hypothetical protein [Gossypium lobatum]TYG40465.1 hypothetical protein ES288_D12G095100v1 [Gossypium darwinii]
MSHTKVHSLGNIPFSWEEKPGVSKSSKLTHYDHQHCPIDSSKNLVHDKKVPPPPPFSKQPLPKRSASVKGWRWWPQDPFLAAYKECTKSGGNAKLTSDASRNGGSKLLRKKKISFSCKDSADVRDDNFVRFSNLPPLPKTRIRPPPEFVYPLQHFF